MENNALMENLTIHQKFEKSFRARLVKVRYMPPEVVFQPVAKAAADFLSHLAEPDNYPRPRGFVLYGSTGCGKTTLCRLMLSFMRGFLSTQKQISLKRILYQNARRIVENFYSDETYLTRLYDDLKRASLILDDLGAEKPVSRYGYSWGLEDLIEERYETWETYHLPTFFTTNIQNPEDMLSRYGERAMSRICGMCNFVQYHYKDRRIYFQ